MPKQIAPGLVVETVGDILDRGKSMPDENPRVAIGDNKPPELTPFEQVAADIGDLYEEAKGWLDGQPISTLGQAEEVGKLRDMLRDAGKRAEELRKTEAKPFDDGKAEVQARYNPLIQKDRGAVDVAIQTANRALAPYLKKIDDDQRAEALRQRAEADRIANEARDAAQLAAQSGDIVDREAAEKLLTDAKDAVKDMKAAERAKPQVAGLSKAIGMKTVYHPELVDPSAAIAHYRQAQPAALKEWMIDQARKDVRAGPKPPAAIPGFKFNEEQVPS